MGEDAGPGSEWTPVALVSGDGSRKDGTTADADAGNDRLSALIALTKKDRFNVDAWNEAWNEATRRGIHGEIRTVYDQFVAVWPSMYEKWIEWIRFEVRVGDSSRVEALFNKALRSSVCVHVSLWREYILYVSSLRFDDSTIRRTTLLKAFDLVLSNVGLDRDSGAIWSDYLAFLQRLVAEGGLAKHEEMQMMDLRRKVFHKALSIPLANIEQIWKDYDAFENALNKLTAKKLIQERSAIYMTARMAFRELKIITSAIDAAQSTWVPTPTSWTETDYEIIRTWKRYIAWEKTNPLRLEDASIVSARVMYAYKSSLAMMRFFPELWYDAARYLIDVGKMDEAASLLAQGVEALPRSLILTFALAELEESRKKDFGEMAKLFDALLAHLETWITETNAKYDAERDTLMALLRSGDSVATAMDSSGWDGEQREVEREKERERNAEIEEKVEIARKRRLGKIREAWSLVWIIYMRVARRSESVKVARNLFKQAKKSELCTHHVYVASALMEYYASKDVGIACRIFEAGMKVFGEDDANSEYIACYLEFLIQQNDENNARALFERALTVLEPVQAREIWTRFLSHEVQNGELSNILKVEKRMKEAYPDDADTSVAVRQIAERWSFPGMEFVAKEELGVNVKSKGPVATTNNAPVSVEVGTFSRATNLDPVRLDSMVLPELSKWSAYKPEAPEKVMEPKVLSSGPPAALISGGSIPIAVPVATQQQQQQQHPSREHLQPPPPQEQAASMFVPECIALLLDRLPPASTYNGPQLPIPEILETLQRLPLPAPSGASKMVAISLNDALSGRGGGSGSNSPMMAGRGRAGYEGGRSGRVNRFAGSGATKRRGGYGSDEDSRFRKR